MGSNALICHSVASCLLAMIVVVSAYAESHTFNVEYNGAEYSYGSGPNPLITDLSVGDDITYILTAAGYDYWETTREYPHFAFLNVTAPIAGTRVSTGTVTYSFSAFQVGASTPATFTLAESIVGGIFTLTHPSKFNTIKITSHIGSADDATPFQINNYQITELNLDWIKYVQSDIPIPGDVNVDGQVSLTDAILSLQTVNGASSSGVQASGDVNNDGLIGIPEAIFALRYLVAP